MPLYTLPDLAVSPGSAAAAPPAPPPALLTSGQLMAALGIHRRMLKKWNRNRVIPSIGVRHARRYDLEQVMEALRTHGPAGIAADCDYHVVPR